MVSDLAPQPPGRRQGGGHRQQRLAARHPAFAAMAQGGAQVSHPLEAQAALDQAIEADQFGGFRQPRLALGQRIGQGELRAAGPPGRSGAMDGQVSRQLVPFQQRTGFLINRRRIDWERID